MQWWNLTKCGLFFNIVFPAVHTLHPSVLQLLGFPWKELSSWSSKSPQLQIWPHHRSDTASCWGTENRWCQIRRIWRVINQFKATVMHSSHCNHRLVCRSIVLVKRDSLRQFSRLFTKCLYCYFSKSWIIQCGFILKEAIQLVSGKVEFNACQVSLLCHNSFLVSLWTFQPTLVHAYITLRVTEHTLLIGPVLTFITREENSRMANLMSSRAMYMRDNVALAQFSETWRNHIAVHVMDLRFESP